MKVVMCARVDYRSGERAQYFAATAYGPKRQLTPTLTNAMSCRTSNARVGGVPPGTLTK